MLTQPVVRGGNKNNENSSENNNNNDNNDNNNNYNELRAYYCNHLAHSRLECSLYGLKSADVTLQFNLSIISL